MPSGIRSCAARAANPPSSHQLKGESNENRGVSLLSNRRFEDGSLTLFLVQKEHIFRVEADHEHASVSEVVADDKARPKSAFWIRVFDFVQMTVQATGFDRQKSV